MTTTHESLENCNIQSFQRRNSPSQANLNKWMKSRRGSSLTTLLLAGLGALPVYKRRLTSYRRAYSKTGKQRRPLEAEVVEVTGQYKSIHAPFASVVNVVWLLVSDEARLEQLDERFLKRQSSLSSQEYISTKNFLSCFSNSSLDLIGWKLFRCRKLWICFSFPDTRVYPFVLCTASIQPCSFFALREFREVEILELCWRLI